MDFPASGAKSWKAAIACCLVSTLKMSSKAYVISNVFYDRLDPSPKTVFIVILRFWISSSTSYSITKSSFLALSWYLSVATMSSGRSSCARRMSSDSLLVLQSTSKLLDRVMMELYIPCERPGCFRRTPSANRAVFRFPLSSKPLATNSTASMVRPGWLLRHHSATFL
ncbi:hypothetical protein F5Y11DRAFT_340088, partial [Daldinia sp. FL1419]